MSGVTDRVVTPGPWLIWEADYPGPDLAGTGAPV